MARSSPKFAEAIRQRECVKCQHMKPKIPASVVSLALVLVCDLVHAQLVPVNWDASGQFAHKTSIAPGKFIEVCEKLPHSSKVAWSFRSAAPLNFNIHYHEGKEVKFPAKRDGSSSAEGVFDVTVEQDYCWMWTNKGTSPATLDLTLKRE